MGELGSAHRLSATVRWGKAAVPATLAVAGSTNAFQTPDGLLATVDEFIRLEMFQPAEKTLNDLAPQIPGDDTRHVRRLERLGTAQRRQGKIAEARNSYTEALTLAIRLGMRDRWSAEAYAGMGYCLQAQGNTDLAAKFFAKALEAGATPETAKAVEAELKKLKE